MPVVFLSEKDVASQAFFLAKEATLFMHRKSAYWLFAGMCTKIKIKGCEATNTKLYMRPQSSNPFLSRQSRI